MESKNAGDKCTAVYFLGLIIKLWRYGNTVYEYFYTKGLYETVVQFRLWSNYVVNVCLEVMYDVENI